VNFATSKSGKVIFIPSTVNKNLTFEDAFSLGFFKDTAYFKYEKSFKKILLSLEQYYGGMDFDKLFQQFLSYEEIITIYEIKLLAFYEKFLITSQDFFEEKDFNKAKKAFANLLFFLNFFKLHNLNLLAMDKWNDFNNFSLNLQKDLNYIVSFFKFYFKEDILLLKYFKKYKKAFKQVFLLEEYFINKAAFLLAFNFSQGIFFMEALSLAAWDTVMHIIIKYKDIEQTRGSIVRNFIIFLDTNMFLRHYIVFF